MVVNFEFLGEEPIENVITCINFKIDKVVFFGYYETIRQQKKITEGFLKEVCGVQTVVFHSLSQSELQSTLNTMRKEILYEREHGNEIYFDITGGESLILVAFGMLSKEFETPMHMYNIVAGKLNELEEGAKACISRDVPTRGIPLTLDMLVRMHGGRINENLQKSIKDNPDVEFAEDVEKIYQVAKKYGDYWNPFSDFVRANMVPDDNLRVSKTARAVLNSLSASGTKLKTPAKLNEIIDSLSDAGVLLGVEHTNGKYRFQFKNQDIKDCLWEGGSILELHTYLKEKKTSSECRVGVHIDWDGIIHTVPGVDVLNEVDVLSLDGNIPTFISCKSGKMGAQQSLHALYELETVAERFGGKYSKKVLVTMQNMADTYKERAAEMGIEVR